jgi:hypothetical protein
VYGVNHNRAFFSNVYNGSGWSGWTEVWGAGVGPPSCAPLGTGLVVRVIMGIKFLGNGVYEFLPALSRGNGVPTPTPLAECTTVELNYGTAKAFEAALGAEHSKLQGETLWYRMVVGGNAPRYVRLRPRASLASILDERADQALPDRVNGLISKMNVETLNLRPNMLVNVTPNASLAGESRRYADA